MEPAVSASLSPDGGALQKWLMRAGCGAKEAVRTLILQGRVAIDGQAITRFAEPVPHGATVTIDGVAVSPPPAERLVWMMNKPRKHLSQAEDRGARLGLGRYLPPGGSRLFPVGRLDYSSEGLLLWTDDGALARRILHPDSHLPKTYQVKIRGHLEPDDPRLGVMRAGMDIGDPTPTRPAQITVGERRARATWVEIVLTEGRNRQIRRMCERLGYQIVKLRRVAIGPLALGNLNPRVARPLSPAERQDLYAAAALGNLPHEDDTDDKDEEDEGDEEEAQGQGA